MGLSILVHFYVNFSNVFHGYKLENNIVIRKIIEFLFANDEGIFREENQYVLRV